MKIQEVQERTPELLENLLNIWEDSVRATHLFLSDAEIKKIKEYVPEAMRGVEHLILAQNDAEQPVAFMGTEKGRLEMLFLSPAERGKGLGKQLLRYGIRNYGIQEVTVMSRTRRQWASMNIWASRPIKERIMTKRAIRIRFYT